MFSNQIDDVFAARKALICYAPVGDPSFPSEMLEIYETCGVDVIEIGLPNEDPYADGAVIANSMRRVSKYASMEEMLRLTTEVKVKHEKIAVTWMCYESADLDSVMSSNEDIGVRGLLMVGFHTRPDKPAIEKWLRDKAMHQIGFVSAELRNDEVVAACNASGYIFLQAFNGKTGVRSGDLPTELNDRIAFLKEAGVTAPIVVGFGISTPQQVRQAIRYGADGVITGSACLQAACAGPDALRRYLSAMREALDWPDAETTSLSLNVPG